jgi:hypothetical protein
MNLCSYAHVIFDEVAPKHTTEKRQPLQQILLRKLDISMHKTKSRSLSFTLYKYLLKVGINFPSIRPKPLKPVEERSDNTLELIHIDNDFLNRT